ncbi:sll0787 family AIR synthase-like protein [Marinoscillum sp. MHG1-6]|uniref:sll0787 family AIR synthase-like protein n=1 Tax=Marinoscillum sp. MHG1-6 TaxID=2959627 RepID=UPI0021578185|nr:sll0787 family AIR synthase-like protein [Marinoscillum sp. MHG1-6]
MTSEETLLRELYANSNVHDKVDIGQTYASLGDEVSHFNFLTGSSEQIQLGDDCAAIKDGQGGYLLFASEGIIHQFTRSHPWFAGYSAIMVNISDICSMGGLPIAVTDVLWTQSRESAKDLWEGMVCASEAYGVPIVGGHTCYRSENTQLAVSIIGQAKNLLTSFGAQGGENIMMAVDLDGDYFEDYPFWNASTTSSPEKLQEIIQLPRLIANEGLSKCAKDISMGGVIGTLDMLCRTSKVGATIDIQSVPKPENSDLKKWLLSFPSYGYIFTCSPENSSAISSIFSRHKITCKTIGKITDSSGITTESIDQSKLKTYA